MILRYWIASTSLTFLHLLVKAPYTEWVLFAWGIFTRIGMSIPSFECSKLCQHFLKWFPFLVGVQYSCSIQTPMLHVSQSDPAINDCVESYLLLCACNSPSYGCIADPVQGMQYPCFVLNEARSASLSSDEQLVFLTQLFLLHSNPNASSLPIWSCDNWLHGACLVVSSCKRSHFTAPLTQWVVFAWWSIRSIAMSMPCFECSKLCQLLLKYANSVSTQFKVRCFKSPNLIVWQWPA